MSTRRRPSPFPPGLALALALAAPLAAQTEWQRVPLLEFVSHPAAAFDTWRDRLVVFGGLTHSGEQDTTWEYDGTDWIRRQPPLSPPARHGAACAFDPVRGVVVLFGGLVGSQRFADTWEWDGAQWLQRQSPASPSARSHAAMAYDSLRGRMLLFGGAPPSGYGLDDTWEYDGTTWTQRQPLHVPGERSAAALAYDPLRDRMVMFGGTCFRFGPCWRMDVWEWDGGDWTDRTAPYGVPTPLPRAEHGMAYDAARQRVVVFGGSDEPNHYKDDVWEWDGVDWTERVLSPGPIGRLGFGFAWDPARQHVVVFGGASWIGYTADLWTLDGGGWHERHAGQQPNVGIIPNGDVAFDATLREVVYCGGFDPPEQTWVFRGERWHRLLARQGPRASDGLRIAWLPAAQRLIAYRPRDWNHADETWSFDGAAWTQLLPDSPGLGGIVELATDPTGDRIVLFGGSDAGVLQNRTFWFDGTDWTDAEPDVSPPARVEHAMALDAARGRVVLFGGRTLQAVLGDTWEWDGTTWHALAPATAPAARCRHGLAFDAGRRRTVLHGGQLAAGTGGDTWEWDGAVWTQRGSTAPRQPWWQSLAYDPETATTLQLASDPFGTWRYGPVQPGTFAPFGQGCGGSAGVPVLDSVAGQRPYTGSHFWLAVERLPGPVAFGALGFSNTSFFGVVPLPANLAPLGFPACELAVQPDDVRVLPLVQGAASWGIWIPAAAPLVGVTFFAQALAFDPTGPDGLAMTRGRACVVGGL